METTTGNRTIKKSIEDFIDEHSSLIDNVKVIINATVASSVITIGIFGPFALMMYCASEMDRLYINREARRAAAIYRADSNKNGKIEVGEALDIYGALNLNGEEILARLDEVGRIIFIRERLSPEAYEDALKRVFKGREPNIYKKRIFNNHLFRELVDQSGDSKIDANEAYAAFKIGYESRPIPQKLFLHDSELERVIKIHRYAK